MQKHRNLEQQRLVRLWFAKGWERAHNFAFTVSERRKGLAEYCLRRMISATAAFNQANMETPAKKTDALTQLCDLLRESNVRMLFWICPTCPPGTVTWAREKGKSTPRCEQCGMCGDPQ